MAEALAAAPIFIALGSAGVALAKKIRMATPANRIKKWDERIAEAIALVDKHSDKIRPEDLAVFHEECVSVALCLVYILNAIQTRYNTSRTDDSSRGSQF